jgi:hypothetical protein
MLRKFWSGVAVFVGAVLIYFEYQHASGISAENVIWILVGLLVVVLGVIDLIQRRPPTKGLD